MFLDFERAESHFTKENDSHLKSRVFLSLTEIHATYLSRLLLPLPVCSLSSVLQMCVTHSCFPSHLIIWTDSKLKCPAHVQSWRTLQHKSRWVWTDITPCLPTCLISEWYTASHPTCPHSWLFSTPAFPDCFPNSFSTNSTTKHPSVLASHPKSSRSPCIQWFLCMLHPKHLSNLWLTLCPLSFPVLRILRSLTHASVITF